MENLLDGHKSRLDKAEKKKSGPVYRTIEILQPNRQKILKKNKQSLGDM